MKSRLLAYNTNREPFRYLVMHHKSPFYWSLPLSFDLNLNARASFPRKGGIVINLVRISLYSIHLYNAV